MRRRRGREGRARPGQRRAAGLARRDRRGAARGRAGPGGADGALARGVAHARGAADHAGGSALALFRAPAPARTGRWAGRCRARRLHRPRHLHRRQGARAHRRLAERPRQPALLLLQRGQRLRGNLRPARGGGRHRPAPHGHHRGRRAFARGQPARRLGQAQGRGRTGDFALAAHRCARARAGGWRAHRHAPGAPSRCAGRGAGGGAAPGSALARDRGAHRSAPVRDHDRAPFRRGGHPGWRGQRQDHHWAASLAYLNFAHPERFPAKRMVVVTQGTALAGYIGQVLPALGVPGVRVLTFQEWAERELQRAIPWLRATVTDDVVPAVTRVKSHPALLHELERRARSPKAKRGKSAVVELWADLLTDRELLTSLMHDGPEMRVSEADIDEAHRILVTRVSAIVSRDPRELPPEEKKPSPAKSRAAERARKEELEDIKAWTSFGKGEGAKKKTVDDDLPEHVRRVEAERDEVDDDENVRGEIGIDGQRTEDDLPILDVDDLAILLRANQLLRKPETPLCHLFVDEAQDLSPMKLAALIGRTAPSGHKGAIRPGSVDHPGRRHGPAAVSRQWLR